MPKKKGGKVLAVVEIGSAMVRMHVSQLKQGAACPLDRLEYPLELSREIRETGKLSMETVRELTGILHGFRAAMTEYGVESCRVYLTAPIQRAENLGFVMGQIRIRTKLEPAPLDGREEQLLLTWKLLSALNLPEAFLQEQGLLVLPGTGALGLTVVNGRNVRLCQSVPVTWPMLSNLRLSAEEAVEEFGEVVEEFVHAAFSKASLYQWKKPAAFAAVIGPESAEVCRMAEAGEESGLLRIEGERLGPFLEEVVSLPPEKMAETYRLSQLDAPGVYAAAASLREVLRHTQAQTVLASPHSLATCMVEHLVPETRAALNEHVAKGALGCAKAMAGRFDCDMVHGELVQFRTQAV